MTGAEEKVTAREPLWELFLPCSGILLGRKKGGRGKPQTLKRFVMTPELKYPRWEEPLMAAFLEFDSEQQCAKVEKAEEAIVRRIQELTFAKGGESELRLLHDGLSLIRQLKERLAQPPQQRW